MSQVLITTEPSVISSDVTTEARPVAPAAPRDLAVSRMSNYLILAKPRISVMVLVTVALGFALGATGPGAAGSIWSWALLNGLAGIGLTAIASGALNQWWERETDGQMPRTARRPLVTGRLSPTEALVFGLILAVAGVAWLAWFVNPLTAILSAVTLLSYTLIYTPLKRVSSVAVILGAIPGAMPPVLGWTASGRGLEAGAFGLFAILFLWQFPHFLAIAWMYRGEYARAGLKMLPGGCDQADGTANTPAGALAVIYALLLIPVSLQPVLVGLAGWVYLVTAMGLGLWYVQSAIGFWQNPNRATARRVLLTSVMHLPLLLAVLVIDHLW
jgi:protoheme IX farnesyltransferase